MLTLIQLREICFILSTYDMLSSITGLRCVFVDTNRIWRMGICRVSF